MISAFKECTNLEKITNYSTTPQILSTSSSPFSGVEAPDAGSVSVAINGTQITVNGISENALVEVFNTNGLLIHSGNDKTISIPAHGVYIVKTAGITRKVVL